MSVLLWILVIGSLLVNAVIILVGYRLRFQLTLLRMGVRDLLRQANNDIASVENMTLNFLIQDKDHVPIQYEVPENELKDVAVTGSVPVKQQIETEVQLKSPLFGAKVPVHVSVPLDLIVPLDLVVPVTIDYKVPVQLDIPVHLDVPVHVNLAETEFGDFIRQVRDSLTQLNKLI